MGPEIKNGSNELVHDTNQDHHNHELMENNPRSDVMMEGIQNEDHRSDELMEINQDDESRKRYVVIGSFETV